MGSGEGFWGPTGRNTTIMGIVMLKPKPDFLEFSSYQPNFHGFATEGRGPRAVVTRSLGSPALLCGAFACLALGKAGFEAVSNGYPQTSAGGRGGGGCGGRGGRR